MENKKKPVTILTGYLGAGKTTVLNELLRKQDAGKLAIVVNDMGKINVDASILKKGTLLEADQKMIELSNGCICCTLQDTFMKQIEMLARQDGIERILVEASGISDPSSIASGFLEYQAMGLCEDVYLDSIVCVADADRIYSEFLQELADSQEEQEKQENQADQADQDPDIINLVMDQIEFCNIILLNKCDLLPVEALQEVRRTLRILQKEAEIVECVQGNVNPERIFQNRPFDFERVLQSSRIQEQLSGKNHGSLEDEHGFTSFVYEEKRPFDYNRFMEFLEKDYPESIIRAKGYVWFQDDDMHVQLFEQAGRNASVTIVSNWVAAFPEDEKQRLMKENPEIAETWDETYGDRMNQIVFIGKQISEEKITERLRQCH